MRLASKKSKLSNEQNLIMENEFLRTIIKVLKEKKEWNGDCKRI